MTLEMTFVVRKYLGITISHIDTASGGNMIKRGLNLGRCQGGALPTSSFRPHTPAPYQNASKTLTIQRTCSALTSTNSYWFFRSTFTMFTWADTSRNGRSTQPRLPWSIISRMQKTVAVLFSTILLVENGCRNEGKPVVQNFRVPSCFRIIQGEVRYLPREKTSKVRLCLWHSRVDVFRQDNEYTVGIHPKYTKRIAIHQYGHWLVPEAHCPTVCACRH